MPTAPRPRTAPKAADSAKTADNNLYSAADSAGGQPFTDHIGEAETNGDSTVLHIVYLTGTGTVVTVTAMGERQGFESTTNTDCAFAGTAIAG